MVLDWIIPHRPLNSPVEDCMHASGLTHHRYACLALTLLLVGFFAAPSAMAQGQRKGHVKHHDSANPPPGHAKGKGKGHQKQPSPPKNGKKGSLAVLITGNDGAPLTTPLALATATQAASNARVSLSRGSFTAPGGDPLPAHVQARLLGLLAGSESAVSPGRVTWLELPGNAVAAREARALTASLDGLLAHPETLPRTVEAFNAFVDQSSPEFLRSPPIEFLVLHAVLTSLLETPVSESAGTVASGR